MMRKKIFMIMIAFLLSVIMLGEGKIASADTKIEQDYLTVWDADEGDTEQSFISLKRSGKLQFSFGEETYGDISIVVSASNGTQLYKKSFYATFNRATFITGELPPGNYTVTLTADSFLTDFDVIIYSIYSPNSAYPEFSRAFKSFTLTKGKTKKLNLNCKPDEATYSVKWLSKNPSIASVSQDGKVKARKKGTTKITAQISTALDTNYETLEWTVIVKNPNPSFTKVAKKMKGFHQKKTLFSMLKKNKKAILYGGSNTIGWNKHLKTQGYGHIGQFYPYIELTKKNGKTSVCLKFKSSISLVSIDRYDTMDIDTLAFKSSGSSISFDYSYTKKKKKIDDGVAVIDSNSFVKLSSDKNENLTQVNKLLKILGKKNVTLKAYSSTEDDYAKYTLNARTKNNWKKFIKNYKKLLKMY